MVPTTRVTREYYFDIQQVTVAPDGYSRSAIAVNGSNPSPTINADWGDQVIVYVTNNLASAKNGSSIHFHGIRQNYTNPNDGGVSITQSLRHRLKPRLTNGVPPSIARRDSRIGLQAWEGVFGGIVINGLATANMMSIRVLCF